MGKIVKYGVEYGGGSGGGNSNEREISLAEYNALTQEEKMDGTVYYVYDVDSSGDSIIVKPVVNGYYDSTNDAFYFDELLTRVVIGDLNKIYIDLTSNCAYRYDGSGYVPIQAQSSSSFTFDDTVTENSDNLVTSGTIFTAIQNSQIDIKSTEETVVGKFLNTDLYARVYSTSITSTSTSSELSKFICIIDGYVQNMVGKLKYYHDSTDAASSVKTMLPVYRNTSDYGYLECNKSGTIKLKYKGNTFATCHYYSEWDGEYKDSYPTISVTVFYTKSSV